MLTYIVSIEFSFDRLVEVSKVDKRQKYFFRQREKSCQSHRSIKVHGAYLCSRLPRRVCRGVTPRSQEKPGVGTSPPPPSSLPSSLSPPPLSPHTEGVAWVG